MLATKVRMLPVCDGERIVGTLATADFLRELSCGGARLGRELLVDFFQRPSESIESDVTLAQARAAFGSAPLLVVVQGDFPLGAITATDIAHAEVQQFARASAPRTLGQWLTTTPTIGPGRSLAEAATLMVEHNLNALAIVSQRSQLAGVITEDRLLRAMLPAG
jgi:CBS domain-containing protein